jgi:hypothetical protein
MSGHRFLEIEDKALLVPDRSPGGVRRRAVGGFNRAIPGPDRGVRSGLPPKETRLGRAGRRGAVAGLAAAALLASVCAAALAGTVAVERSADGRAGVVFRGSSAHEGIRLSSLGTTDRVWQVGQAERLGATIQAGESCTIPSYSVIECVLPDGVPSRPAVVYGEAGSDVVDLHLVGWPVLAYGGPGDDDITSGELLGQGGPLGPTPPGSEIFGGPGDDQLNEFGADWGNRQRYPPSSCRNRRALFGAKLVGGPGQDRVCDTAGDDLMVVRDGEQDLAGCTAGRDVVVADRLDFVGGACEQIRRAGRHGALAFDLYGSNDEGTWVEVFAGCQADGPRLCDAELRLREPGRDGRLLRRKRFRVVRGEVIVLVFPWDDEPVNRLARTGVRATVVTKLRSGRVMRATRLLDVPRLLECC